MVADPALKTVEKPKIKNTVRNKQRTRSHALSVSKSVLSALFLVASSPLSHLMRESATTYLAD